MALLCPAGVMAEHHSRGLRDGRQGSEGMLQAVEAMEREDSMLPLLGPGSPVALPDTFGVEHERAVSKALILLGEQLNQLKAGSRALNRTETSELLRDTCQALAELSTGLEERWRKGRPNEPMPSWPVNAIPEEELGQIGWDFHANRVQIRDTGGSVWESLGFLFNHDPQAGFAKPPSAESVSEALSRVAARLSHELEVAGGASPVGAGPGGA